jgi:hypothetical protein
MEELSIQTTRHGGFIVTMSVRHTGEFNPPLFAGALDDCLAFMRGLLEHTRFSTPVIQPQDAA